MQFITRLSRRSAILGLALLPTLLQAQTPAVVATGLESPYKLAFTGAGHLLVAEAAPKVNGGRLTWVHRSTGAKQVILDGLPTNGSTTEAEGISGIGIRERSIYILMGEGDVVVNGTVPGTQVPNPKAALSPIFSSLLELRFSRELESITQPFTLTPADQVKLADGIDVELDNGAGARLTIQMVADFANFRPDPNTIARASHPFGIDFDRQNPNIAYVPDSGQNKLLRVDLNSGRTRTVATFPPLRNTSGIGGPVSDVVPTSVRSYGDQVLVSYLSGFPFTPGAAGVYLVDPRTGTFTPFLTNNTSLMDIAVRERPGGARPQFFALEFTANLLAQPGLPGRLLRYDTETAVVQQEGLVTPVAMAMDGRTGEIFITELGTGRIVRVDVR